MEEQYFLDCVQNNRFWFHNNMDLFEHICSRVDLLRETRIMKRRSKIWRFAYCIWCKQRTSKNVFVQMSIFKGVRDPGSWRDVESVFLFLKDIDSCCQWWLLVLKTPLENTSIALLLAERNKWKTQNGIKNIEWNEK